MRIPPTSSINPAAPPSVSGEAWFKGPMGKFKYLPVPCSRIKRPVIIRSTLRSCGRWGRRNCIGLLQPWAHARRSTGEENDPAGLWFTCPWRTPGNGMLRKPGLPGSRLRCRLERGAPTARAPGRPLVIVARDALGFGDLLILDRRLQHHAVGKIIDDLALDLLPGRLMRRIVIAAMPLQIGAATIVFFLRDQDVGAALVEVDAHAIARF